MIVPRKFFRNAVVTLALALALTLAASPALAQVKCAKIDNFLMLVDVSGSRRAEFATQLELMVRINTAIPDGRYNAALRTFYRYAHDPGRGIDLIIPPGLYSRSAFEVAFTRVTDHAGARTPLGPAMAATAADLAQMSGTKALVIFSDFEWSEGFGDPVAQARELKAAFPDLSIYAIGLSAIEENVQVGRDIVAAAGAGKYYDARTLEADQAAFDAMLQDIFIDEQSCHPVRISLHLEFDTDKSDIRPEYHDEIAKAARYLTDYPNSTAVIEGHTDSDGSDEYNQKLSQARAESLRDYMVEKFGIAADRLRAVGLGESHPVADNDTPAGKQKNRRVDVVISGAR